MAVGAQLGVFGVASRSTAAGGCRFFCGDTHVDTAQNPSALTDLRGARIGGYANANGTTNGFDLYYIVGFAGTLSNAQAGTVAAALVAAYGVAPVERQIVLEGDSITDGIGTVTSGRNLAMALTEPGAELVPPGTRVLNMAMSGGRVANLVTRRDAAAGWPIALLPGGSANNILAVQIGRNDSAQGAGAVQIRDDLLSYLNAQTVGVLARGFDVRVAVNIANGSMAVIGSLRELLRDPAFLGGLDAGAGQAGAGRAALVELDRIEAPIGVRRFDSAADTVGSPYYQAGDTTHPSAAGTYLLATGGATPMHGYGAIL